MFFAGYIKVMPARTAGIDLGYGPLYAGVWAADLDNDNGIEYDIYAGVDFAIGESYHAGVGYTIYRYTDDSDRVIDTDADGEDIFAGFDDDYDEVNFFAGGAFGDFNVELEYTVGEHDNLDGSDNDYDFFAVTLDYKGAYVTIGEFGISEDGEGEPDDGYIELGYGMTVSGIDLAAAIIDSDDGLDDEDDDGDETRVIFSASYSFNILGGEE